MPTRRTFLQAAGLTSIGGSVLAGRKKTTVQLRPEIEPIVRLIERTPREKCVEVVARQVQRGLPYRDFLAALFLAGIRNVNPQPPGFKFHCVFVIHAAHQVSLDVPADQRLLPLFWALDNFKVSQQRDVQQGDFVLRPVQGKLPSPERSWAEFHQAMNDWDEEKADRAIAAVARNAGAQQIAANMWQYGARDYRNIGHKAIFVANTWQTLQTIGWQHAEPALRSLVLGLLDFGKDKRVNNYAYGDQCFLPNVERVRKTAKKLQPGWTAKQGNASVTKQLLASIGSGDVSASCDLALQALQGKAPATAQAVWDAVHLAAGELMMQQPGIYGIHTVTSAHGLRYAFDVASDPESRLLMMLQGVGWMCQFHNFMKTRNGGLRKTSIGDLNRVAATKLPQQQAVTKVLSNVTTRRSEAASDAFAWARKFPTSAQLSRAAKQLVATKATDAHHFKYSTSILTDAEKVSPEYRPHLFATAAYYLCGSKQGDSSAVRRARAALASGK